MNEDLLKEIEKSNELLSLIPREQIVRVFHQKECEIDSTFLGFIDIYKNLSQIIPKHFTIVDLGCAYNPQCFYFKDHKKYIAVDISDCEKFKSDNCDIFHKSIEDFIRDDISTLDMNETFAICSYVPPWGGDNRKMVRETFYNLFTYYPHGGFKVTF